MIDLNNYSEIGNLIQEITSNFKQITSFIPQSDIVDTTIFKIMQLARGIHTEIYTCILALKQFSKKYCGMDNFLNDICNLLPQIFNNYSDCMQKEGKLYSLLGNLANRSMSAAMVLLPVYESQIVSFEHIPETPDEIYNFNQKLKCMKSFSMYASESLLNHISSREFIIFICKISMKVQTINSDTNLLQLLKQLMETFDNLLQTSDPMLYDNLKDGSFFLFTNFLLQDPSKYPEHTLQLLRIYQTIFDKSPISGELITSDFDVFSFESLIQDTTFRQDSLKVLFSALTISDSLADCCDRIFTCILPQLSELSEPSDLFLNLSIAKTILQKVSKSIISNFSPEIINLIFKCARNIIELDNDKATQYSLEMVYYTATTFMSAKKLNLIRQQLEEIIDIEILNEDMEILIANIKELLNEDSQQQ